VGNSNRKFPSQLPLRACRAGLPGNGNCEPAAESVAAKAATSCRSHRLPEREQARRNK